MAVFADLLASHDVGRAASSWMRRLSNGWRCALRARCGCCRRDAARERAVADRCSWARSRGVCRWRRQRQRQRRLQRQRLIAACSARAPGVCSNTHPEHDPREANRTRQGRERQRQQQRQQRHRRQHWRSLHCLIRFFMLCACVCAHIVYRGVSNELNKSCLHRFWCTN